jgi:hypothetical protein
MLLLLNAMTSLLTKHCIFALRRRLLEAPKEGRKLAVSLPQFSFHSGRPPLALSHATRVPEPSCGCGVRIKHSGRQHLPMVQQRQTACAMS